MDFYDTPRWKSLRYRILRRSQGKCELCSSVDKLQVDHIKPRSKYPELQWEESNLQCLCKSCNEGKSNKFNDDWRRNRILPKLDPDKLKRFMSDSYLKTEYEPFEIEHFGESK